MGGSPRSASTFSTPAAAYRARMSSSSARVCAAQVRCAIAVIDVWSLIHTTRSCVALAGRAAGAVGDRHERRVQPLELAQGLLELRLGRRRLRREELERVRRSVGERCRDPHARQIRRCARSRRPWNRRRRSELVTTNTDENAIAPAAIIGFSSPSAASGIAATLYANAQNRLPLIVASVRRDERDRVGGARRGRRRRA